MSLIRDVLQARRLAPELNDRWRSTGLTVIDPKGAIIARFTKPTLANLVVLVHNTWLELSNQWLLMLRMVQDRAFMAEAEKEEQKWTETHSIPKAEALQGAGHTQCVNASVPITSQPKLSVSITSPTSPIITATPATVGSQKPRVPTKSMVIPGSLENTLGQTISTVRVYAKLRAKRQSNEP